jgi:hypothetical protein
MLCMVGLILFYKMGRLTSWGLGGGFLTLELLIFFMWNVEGRGVK